MDAKAIDLAAHHVSSERPGEPLDALARRLVRDLNTPRPLVFWADLLASAAVGWTAFAVALLSTPWSPVMAGAAIISALALYRGLCFTHEITHLRRRSVPGFETAWNLLLGVPMLLPSFTYVGVHQQHHNLSTYGTRDDPEYLPFATSRRMILIFAVQSSLLLPLLLVARFLLLAPIGLASPRLHAWLETHASSFAMNPLYRRQVSAAMARTMRRWEVLILMAWAAAIGAIGAGLLPGRTLVLWYVVIALISFVNTLRVLGAHDYESDGTPHDRLWQLEDSIDTPGGPWTALWAPVGLRYHALHHYFPGIPYHNLGTAYRRLVRTLPVDAGYHASTSRSLPHSLGTLYRKAGALRIRG